MDGSSLQKPSRSLMAGSLWIEALGSGSGLNVVFKLAHAEMGLRRNLQERSQTIVIIHTFRLQANPFSLIYSSKTKSYWIVICSQAETYQIL